MGGSGDARGLLSVTPALALCLVLATSWNGGCRDTAADRVRREPQPAQPETGDVEAVPFVDSAALEPKVLHDQVAMSAYLREFPKKDYRVRRWAGVGRFHIDLVDDAIKQHINSGAGWEAHIKKLIEEHTRPGSAALDIGAHIGTHTMSMAKAVGVTGQVFAFEPQRKLFRELVENLKLNRMLNVTPLRFAIGEGDAMIVEMGKTATGNEGGTGIGSGGDQVELRTIDSFGFRRVSLVKIDVEGFENHVIRGAQETLARERPLLIVEILGGVVYDTATPEQRRMIDETKALIASLGYRVERVGPHDYMGFPEIASEPTAPRPVASPY